MRLCIFGQLQTRWSWNRENAFEEDAQKQQKFFGALLPNCKAGFIAHHKSSSSQC
jgi:hypothetical protein